VVVSGGEGVVVSGGEGVVVSGCEGVVVSLGEGAFDGLDVVMMVSGGHVVLLPMNITSARYTQLKPGKGKNCR
jgi:hypothetical protein